MNWLIAIVLWLLICYIVVRLLTRLWYKMHEFVGIEVGTSRYALPYNEPLRLSQQSGMAIPNSFANDKIFQFQPLAYPNSASHRVGNKESRRSQQVIPAILGIDARRLGRMPTPAVMVLDEIQDKLLRYQAWQQQQTELQNQTTGWLTENKFVINRLIEQTIPEAVNQYDQIAQFHPMQLSQKIYDDMTAGEMLVAVLQQVNQQLNQLLDEMFNEVSQQFATTYRYVKQRTEPSK